MSRSGDTLSFVIVSGGAAYITPPAVTIGGLTGCTLPTNLTAQITQNRVTSINSVVIDSSCTGTPTVSVANPPNPSGVTCSSDARLIVAPPSGTSTGVTATAHANSSGTLATVDIGGSGYTSIPAVTVSGGTCTKMPSATATVVN